MPSCTVSERSIGPKSLIRADVLLQIHRDEDDLGLGGVPASVTTGNAGPRIACCVINSCIFPYY